MRNIKKLIKIQKMVAKYYYKHIGFISVDGTGVHITDTLFFRLFNMKHDIEKNYLTEEYDEYSVNVDGVKIFCLSERK